MEMEMEMEMEKLPTEIASNILSRLPFDSVIQFKCLSKYWYNLLQRLIHTSGELYFAQNHRTRLMENYTFLRYSYKSLLFIDSALRDEEFGGIHEYPPSSFSSSSLPDSVLLMLDHHQSTTTTTLDTNEQHHLLLHYAEYDEDQKGWFNCKAVKKLNCPLPVDIIINSPNFWTMSTSSNGLLCSLVVHNSSYLFCIYNPFLGEYVTLPDDNDDEDKHTIGSCTMAFGFSHIPSTDEYKVVRIVYPNTTPGGSHVGNIEVYTLGGGGGGKWRSKGIIKRRLQCDTPGVLVNGSLHWLTEEDERYKKIKGVQHIITVEQDAEFMQKIMVFNLVEEEFGHMIRAPYHTNFRIKEWGGCLCGFNNKNERRMHYTWKFYMYYGRHLKNKAIVDGDWKKIFSIIWSGGGGGLIEPYEDLFFYIKANQALLWTSYISKKKRKSYKSNSLVVAVEMDDDWRRPLYYDPKELKAAKLFHGIFHIKSFVSLKALGENNTKRIIYR